MASPNGSPNPSPQVATPGDPRKPTISDLTSPYPLQASSFSGSCDVLTKEVDCKREIYALRQKCELLEEANSHLERAKQQMEEEKVKMQLERYNMNVNIEKLNDRLKEMQKREWKADERNRRLITDGYEARREEKKRLEKVSAENRNLSVQRRNLREELMAVARQLEEIKLRDAELIMELNRTVDALKSDILVKEREFVNEKEVLLGKYNDLELELNRTIEALKADIKIKEADYATLVREKEVLQEENKNLVLELNRTIEGLKADIAIKAHDSARLIKEADYATLVREKEVLQEENKNLDLELNRTIEGLKADIAIKEHDSARLRKEMEILKETNKKLESDVARWVRGDHWEVDSGSDFSPGCRKKTPHIESAASMSHNQHKVNADIVVLSDGEDEDRKVLSEAFRLKRPRSDMFNRGGKTQSLDRSTPGYNPDMLLKNLSQTTTSLPAPGSKTAEEPAATPQYLMQKLSPSYVKVKLETEFRERDVGGGGKDLLCTPDVMNILDSCQKSRKQKIWSFDTDLVCALESDPELCLKAICTLDKQHKLAGTRGNRFPPCGFKPDYAIRGVDLAKYLINGDPEGRMTRSMAEYKRYYPDGLDQCKFIAKEHKKELFVIYKNNLDPFFP